MIVVFSPAGADVESLAGGVGGGVVGFGTCGREQQEEGEDRIGFFHNGWNLGAKIRKLCEAAKILCIVCCVEW